MAACVCELTEPLGLTQPTISHHLKILVHAGIFTRDKRGVWSHYSSSSQPWTPCLQCSAPHAEPGVADEIDIAKAEAVEGVGGYGYSWAEIGSVYPHRSGTTSATPGSTAAAPSGT